MEIKEFHQDTHGDVLFVVDKSICHRIVDHLKSRGILATAAVQESDAVEIDADVPIDTLNLALKSFTE